MSGRAEAPPRPAAPPALATIGYEAATLGQVIGRLGDAGVEIVIDVRAVAASRRPGFSKTLLAASLAAAGIDYVHLRALGTPAAGREAARKGRQAELERIYAGQLELPEAMVQAAQMLELAAERPSALLCFEREPAACHRSLLLSSVAPEVEVVDLFA
ncbi:MAG: DUF488 domain-containing protein [Caulobacteraceae bacterium]|nr:DUF488 domain-containing protein [Caulobacteraceae bacterium]